MVPEKRSAMWLCVGLLGTIFGLSGCGSDDSPSEEPVYELPFKAFVGDTQFSCAGNFEGLGLSKTTASPLDFRFYVHDVELIRASGERVPLRLVKDGTFQREEVALLDFEDASGSCNTGSPSTHESLFGRAPKHDDYTGVAFSLGLPEAMNHLDAATAPAPLNVPGMWWSWQGGYKFLKVDMASEANPEGFFFHLGATNCEGSVRDGFSCQYANLARIELSGLEFNGGKATPISVDAATFYEGVDLSQAPDFETDNIAGCMAFPGDPECPAMFDSLGLAFEGGSETELAQRAFKLQ